MCQWHQLDHMQVICSSLQTNNHASPSPIKFFTGQMLSCYCPTNSVKAPKAHILLLLLLRLLLLQPFYDPLSRTTRVSRYYKDIMMGWQWHQLNHMQAICTLLQKITMPALHHSDFYGPDALPDTQPTASKH